MEDVDETLDPADEGDERGEPTDEEAKVGSLLFVIINFISGDDKMLAEFGVCSAVVVVGLSRIILLLDKSRFFIRLLPTVVLAILAKTYFVVVVVAVGCC